MKASQTMSHMTCDSCIEGFISSQVTGRGLDARTEKAYRMDLKLLYGWLSESGIRQLQDPEKPATLEGWGRQIEAYLAYLARDKKLRTSTISRKARVFRYYVTYLANEGLVREGQTGSRMRKPKEGPSRTASGPVAAHQAHVPDGPEATLSKQEVDALFQSMAHEYETLDSDFRRRVCLRDQVMLKLLFYHGIEISELLELETTDYDRKHGILTVRGKRGKQRTIPIFSAGLRRQLARWLEEQEYFQRKEQYSTRMFLSKLGKPLSMKMVILIFDKYRVMAGIEKECTPRNLKTSMVRYGQEMVMEGCG